MQAARKDDRIIFIVDDDDSVRRALARLLRSAGLACETFGSGADLIARLRPGSRGCLVIDMRMPGMTGDDLMARLTVYSTRLPTIMLSAQDTSETRERARALGAVAFFRKPVDDQALLDAILWCLDGQGPPRP